MRKNTKYIHKIYLPQKFSKQEITLNLKHQSAYLMISRRSIRYKFLWETDDKKLVDDKLHVVTWR